MTGKVHTQLAQCRSQASCLQLPEVEDGAHTCSEGGKAGAVNGEAVHRLPCAGSAAAARCGGTQNQAAAPVGC